MPVEWIKISAHYDVIKKKLGEKWNKNRFPIIISLMIKPADSEKANWSALTLHRNGSANIEREEKRENKKQNIHTVNLLFMLFFEIVRIVEQTNNKTNLRRTRLVYVCVWCVFGNSFTFSQNVWMNDTYILDDTCYTFTHSTYKLS